MKTHAETTAISPVYPAVSAGFQLQSGVLTEAFVRHGQRDIAPLPVALNDDNQLSVEEFHAGFGERFEACGIAIAGSFERCRAAYVERQRIIGRRNERPFRVNQRNSDETKVIAVGMNAVSVGFQHEMVGQAGRRYLLRTTAFPLAS